MSTPSPSTAPGVALCGCLATAVEQGRHNHVCLISQTVHLHTGWITSSNPQDRRPLLLHDLAAANPVWGEDEVLPDKTVLLLTASVSPGVDLGLWQRQATDLVPVTEAAYGASVSACTYGSCGLCDTCFSYRARAENCIADATDAAQAVTSAAEALDDALAKWNTLCANSDAGDGFDLSGIVVRDGRRGLENARYHLRVTDGVLARHLAHITAMDPARDDLD